MPIITLPYIKEKWQHAGFQRYFQNMNWIFFAKIASMIISFVATAYIARNLGPTNYGQLSYALSFVGLFGFIAALGIDQILYRDLVKYPDKHDGYMGTALALRLSTSILSVIICTLSAMIFSTKDVSQFLIFIISLTFIFSSFQLLNYEFQAAIKSKYTSVISLIIVLILNILKIILVSNDKGVIYLASVVLLEPVLYAIGFIYFRIKIFGTIRNWFFDKNIAKQILRDSLPIIFASAFFAIYARIDQVMIKNMIGPESVGLYSSAVTISEAWYFIPNIITGALFPAIVNSKKVSEILYYKRIQKMFLLLIAVSIVTALPTAILAKYFIAIIFGTGFIGALSVLQIYVWSNIGATLNMFAQQLLIVENHTKIIFAITFLGMISNVLLNIVLIPKYGISGAAFASLVSYLVPFFSLLAFKESREMAGNIFKKYI